MEISDGWSTKTNIWKYFSVILKSNYSTLLIDMRAYPSLIQSERRYGRNVICLAVMSTLLTSSLPAMGQSSRTVPDDRGSSLLSFNLQDLLRNTRQIRRPQRTPRLPAEQPVRPNPFFKNPQPRPTRRPAPISPQE
jgi:hypothetical protein